MVGYSTSLTLQNLQVLNASDSQKFGETMASDEQRQLGVAVGVERCRSGASDGPIAGARGSTDGIPFQPLNFSKRSPRKVPSKSELRK